MAFPGGLKPTFETGPKARVIGGSFFGGEILEAGIWVLVLAHEQYHFPPEFFVAILHESFEDVAREEGSKITILLASKRPDLL